MGYYEDADEVVSNEIVRPSSLRSPTGRNLPAALDVHLNGDSRDIAWGIVQDIMREKRARRFASTEEKTEFFRKLYGGKAPENLRERLRREKEELETAVTQLAGKLAERTRQLEHLRRYPEDDPFTDGVILRFEKRFPTSDAWYSYVASRISGAWYLTGARSPQNISWDELVEFMGLGVDEVWQVNGIRRTRNGNSQQVERKVIG